VIDKKKTKHRDENLRNEATEKVVEELRARIEELNTVKERLDDSYLRLAAEYDNYKKRQTKNFGEMVSAARDTIILKVLDILDNFERVLESSEEPPSVESIVEGVNLIHKQFHDMLVSENIVSVCEVGDRFDPSIHEAIALVPSDEDENRVVDLMQKGYRCGDRLIRPARVLVSGPRDDEENLGNNVEDNK